MIVTPKDQCPEGCIHARASFKHVHCSQCGRACQQVSVLTITHEPRSIAGVSVWATTTLFRGDGLAEKGIPPFVCEPCIRAAYTLT